MSELAERIAREHGTFMVVSGNGAFSVSRCLGCGAETMTAARHIATVTEAAVREQVAGEMVDAASVEAASREMFWADDLGGHHKPGYQPHTWENIPEVGRENYRTGIRAALAVVAERIARGGAA